MADAYKKAGVDIDAGERLVSAITPLAKATARAGADAALGGFGGLFDLKAAGYRDPILVSGTDGVGTKLKIAFETGVHDTIGIDLVAMCVNDVLAQGAEPLFFLDYFATGKLEEGVAAQVIKGVADGCRQAGCALIGGETAEMPGMYAAGEYDLAGFCVGAVEREDVLPRPVRAGDVMIGLASSGPHSNGYSLIRKIAADAGVPYTAPAPFDNEKPLGAALLVPTRIYVKSVLPLLKRKEVRGFAHITGGGLTDNVPRLFDETLTPRFDEKALALPPLFAWLQKAGGLTTAEMHRTFNCGVGGVLVAAPDAADAVVAALAAAGETARLIGHIAKA
ncbi:MAG: phosphoribosylformylglycinamidine cyclo-ligase [Pseudomonadota bacterium]|nr:phosphoribosylformylglycinamidine cyclo-ligase [Pseudomonadota bacterium]